MNRNGVNSTVGLLKYLATALGSEGFGYGHHLVSYVHQKHTFTQLYTIFPVNQSYISATKSCYGNMEESEELGMVFKRVANKPNEFFRAIGFQADEKDQKNFWISSWVEHAFYFEDYQRLQEIHDNKKYYIYDQTRVLIMRTKVVKSIRTRMYDMSKKVFLLDPDVVSKINYFPNPNEVHLQDITNISNGKRKYREWELYGYNQHFGWRNIQDKEYEHVTKIMIDQANKVKEEKNSTVVLVAGCRSNSISGNNEVSLLPKISHLYYQGKANRRFNCLWLSVCLMVHRKLAEDAIQLYNIMNKKGHNNRFKQMYLSKKQEENCASTILRESGTSFEMRRVEGFLANKKDCNYFLNFVIKELRKDVICVLKDSNGCSNHAIGIAAAVVPKYIYDPMEKNCLLLTKENLDHCCGESVEFNSVASMREITYY